VLLQSSQKVNIVKTKCLEMIGATTMSLVCGRNRSSRRM